MPSLADAYCAHHQLPPERFARHALVRALTLQAQLLYPLLRWSPDFFDADLEFITTVGRAATLRDFTTDAMDFKLHPDNNRPLRRLLRLRVSSRKLRRLFSTASATQAAAPANSPRFSNVT